MNLKTDRNCHALYNLQYHLIIATKYRRKVINDEVFATIKAQFERIASLNGGNVDEINYEPDHVHVLLSMPPQTCLSNVISTMKATTSRKIRNLHKEYIEKFYWKDFFWNRSYLILSSGGAPVDVIKAYIKEQGTDEHKTKSEVRKQKPR